MRWSILPGNFCKPSRRARGAQPEFASRDARVTRSLRFVVFIYPFFTTLIREFLSLPLGGDQLSRGTQLVSCEAMQSDPFGARSIRCKEVMKDYA